MEFIKDDYSNKSIDTIRDDDGNLMSVTSSQHSFYEDDQFIELKNTNYRNSKTNLINYDFTEYNLAEQTTADRIVDFFNLYNDVKNSIKITGNTDSHEYLFNSSKVYLGRQNLIVVDETEYSNVIVNNKNLLDDLRVKDEIQSAELESAYKELTALYETVNSIKGGVISIIDSTIVPAVEDNTQLKYAMLSLKAIVGQTLDYLIQNKTDLKISKKSINDYDIISNKGGNTSRKLNNTITYNYLSDPSYFNNIFNDLLLNPSYIDTIDRTSDLNSQISTLTSDNAKLKADKLKLEGTVQQLNAKIDSLNSIIIALGGDPDSGGTGDDGTGDDGTGDDGTGDDGTGDDGTGGGDSQIDKLLKVEYNKMYDSMMPFIDKYIIDSEQWKNGSMLSKENFYQYQELNNNKQAFLTSLSDGFYGSKYDEYYSTILKLSNQYVSELINQFNAAIEGKFWNIPDIEDLKKQIFSDFGKTIYEASINTYKPQFEQYGRL